MSEPDDRVIERTAVISGAGQSDVGRRLFRDPLELTLDACLAAIADAGLTTEDIDGIATYPGPMAVPPGFSGAGVVDVQDALRLELGWWSGGIESPGQLGSVINACLAVAAGLATHVLCFRSVCEGSAQGDKGRAAVHARWRRRRRRLQGQRVHGVDAAVRRAVGGALDRDDGAAPLPRVRHDARAARPDRAQRAQERGAEPEGDLHATR